MSRADIAYRLDGRAFLATLGVIFATAVAVNYPWEIAQAPLYAGTEWSGRSLWHCFVASLGDGLLVLLIFAVGWAVVGRRSWFERPRARGWAAMEIAGLSTGIGVELAAVHVLGRWAYSPRMPLVPGLGIGIVPVVQMLVLPPLIFHIAARWHARSAKDAARRGVPDAEKERR